MGDPNIGLSSLSYCSRSKVPDCALHLSLNRPSTDCENHLKFYQEVSMQGSKLYVGNLNYSTTSADLEKLFGEYGTVKSINIIGDKGFGFIEMSSSAEAEAAQEELNGNDFMGRKLNVDEARPPKQGGGRGGRGGGGGGGRGRGGFGGGGGGGGRRW